VHTSTWIAFDVAQFDKSEINFDLRMRARGFKPSVLVKPSWVTVGRPACGWTESVSPIDVILRIEALTTHGDRFGNWISPGKSRVTILGLGTCESSRPTPKVRHNHHDARCRPRTLPRTTHRPIGKSTFHGVYEATIDATAQISGDGDHVGC
jgi:hypothetical protein